MGYERGLISLTTEDAIANGRTKIFRPRLLGYALVLIAMIGVFSYSITTRVPLGLEVLRDRGVRMYRIAGDDVQNVYTLKIHNMDGKTHIYDVEASGDYPFDVQGYRPVPVEDGEILSIPVRVVVNRKELKDVQTEVNITVTARDNPELSVSHEASYIGPKR